MSYNILLSLTILAQQGGQGTDNWFTSNWATIIGIVITIIGFVVSYLFNKKAYKDEIKKMKFEEIQNKLSECVIILSEYIDIILQVRVYEFYKGTIPSDKQIEERINIILPLKNAYYDKIKYFISSYGSKKDIYLLKLFIENNKNPEKLLYKGICPILLLLSNLKEEISGIKIEAIDYVDILTPQIPDDKMLIKQEMDRILKEFKEIK